MDPTFTPLEQYKLVREEYMFYSGACRKNDLLILGWTAAFYSWIWTHEPVSNWLLLLGPILIGIGFVRGHWMEEKLKQMNEYLALIEDEKPICGWHKYQKNPENALRILPSRKLDWHDVEGNVGRAFWLFLWVLSAGIYVWHNFEFEPMEVTVSLWLVGVGTLVGAFLAGLWFGRCLLLGRPCDRSDAARLVPPP